MFLILLFVMAFYSAFLNPTKVFCPLYKLFQLWHRGYF